jgi:hypothetical protein
MSVHTLSPIARATLAGGYLFPPHHASLPGKSRAIQAGVIRELIPAFLAGDPRCTRLMINRVVPRCGIVARPLLPFIIRRLPDYSTCLPDREYDYRVLAELVARPALPLFARLLADGPRSLQWSTARAFQRYGQTGVPWLLNVLRDAAVRPLRRLAAYRLLEQGGALAVVTSLPESERRGLALTFYVLAARLDSEDQRHRWAVAAYTSLAPTQQSFSVLPAPFAMPVQS